MAVVHKSWITRAAAILLALFALAAVYSAFMRAAASTRPWRLEAYLELRMAECRRAPGAGNFGKEYALLSYHAEEAKRSLQEADRQWWLWRDYTDCLPRLLSACLDAQLLALELAQRQLEQETKLAVILASLRRELGTNAGSVKIWSRFELRNLEQTRARSLLQQAEYLASAGEIESALVHAFRAAHSWQRFSDESDRDFARFEDGSLRTMWDQQAMKLLHWTRQSGRRAILIDKLEHRCVLLSRGQVEKSYPANLGRSWHHRKIQELDASTPEGRYRIRRMTPSGRYGPAMQLDYPTSADRALFRALMRKGAISRDSRIGGNLEIHGKGRLDSDWTDGCVSLEDNEMRDLYSRSYSGMPVTIVGTCRLISSSQGQ
jgi:hypothetical protein